MKNTSTKSILIVLIVLVIAMAGAAGYFYLQYSKVKKNPQAVAQAEVDQLVAKVGQLIVLPTDETPTIATVSDPEKLKDQAFFKSAQAGYKVLIYTKAKKAVLYDPITNKIVEVAPLSIGDQSKTSTTPKSTTPTTTTPATGTTTTPATGTTTTPKNP
ncbi:MAG: hypothetical protein RL641_700 [Candidatus Parcubacteria bacterium]|jgi:hypothetical protein